MKIGILSDIHEDISSLSRALKILEKERCDQVVSLGDIVGFDHGHYGDSDLQDAEACIRLVRENCFFSVAGNHDLFAVKKLPRFKARFTYPTHWYALSLKERQRLGKGRLWDYSKAEDQVRLSDESRTYLSRLPEFIIHEVDGIRILFSHHLFPDPSGSLRKMPSWAPNIWTHLYWMKRHGCSIGISGHLHIEGTLRGTWHHLHYSSGNQFFVNGTRTWFSCPPVTLGGVSSGLMILDTTSGLVTTRLIDTPVLS
ncbi:MAG: metallophosphoesterase family protein [Bacteroidales bacterium]|nr:metallophosphoesterase family protein [Bacteroidales bacterium]